MKSIAFIALIAGVQSVRVAREPLLSWAPTEPASAFKKNYFVPHFGEDRDITHSKNSIVVAENQLGHKWNIKDEDDPPKRNYFDQILLYSFFISASSEPIILSTRLLDPPSTTVPKLVLRSQNSLDECRMGELENL